MYQDNIPSNGSGHGPIFIRGIGFIPPRETLAEGRERVATSMLYDRDERDRDETVPLPPNTIIRVYKPWYVDLGLRVAGLCALGISAISLYLLVQFVHRGPSHPATWVEMLLAACSFLGASCGSLMLCLGAHLCDRVVLRTGSDRS